MPHTQTTNKQKQTNKQTNKQTHTHTQTHPKGPYRRKKSLRKIRAPSSRPRRQARCNGELPSPSRALTLQPSRTMSCNVPVSPCTALRLYIECPPDRNMEPSAATQSASLGRGAGRVVKGPAAHPANSARPARSHGPWMPARSAFGGG